MVLEMVMLECDCEFECEWLHNVTDSKYYIKCSLKSTHSTIRDGVGDCVSIVIREWDYACECVYV